MSTTDSEDPDTEVEVPGNMFARPQSQSPAPEHIEPAQVYSDMLRPAPEENQEDGVCNIDSDKFCIFPYIDLETAGNGLEDWEVFNVLCGINASRKNVKVSGNRLILFI